MISIAVSAVFRPSLVLRCFIGGVSLTTIAVGFLVVIGWIGEISLIAKIIIAGICFYFAWIGFSHCFRDQKACRIDISGTGKIHLMIYKGLTGDMITRLPHFSSADIECNERVNLMEGSTLWPHLLLLLLQTENGRVYTLLILPDCVSVPTFRALATACRWIAGHNHEVDTKIF